MQDQMSGGAKWRIRNAEAETCASTSGGWLAF